MKALSREQQIEIVEEAIRIYDTYDKGTFECICTRNQDGLCNTLYRIAVERCGIDKYALIGSEDLIPLFKRPANSRPGLWWWRGDDLRSRREYLKQLLKKIKKMKNYETIRHDHPDNQLDE